MLKHTTKGQMEIFGLLIIITLIILGMIFVLRFVVMKPPSEIKESFTQEEIASNMLDAILDTKPTGCYVNTFADLLEDCAEFSYLGGTIYCNNKLSCDFAEHEIEKILDNSLKQWAYNYEFILSSGDSVLFTVNNNKCPGQRDTATQPMPGGIEIKFHVCI